MWGRIRGRSEWVFFLAVLTVTMACRHLWPADTPWINDEPYLFDWAADMLSGAGLATRGLGGSVGVIYSPIPVWIFAGLLSFSRDLVAVATLRTALFDLTLAIALIWLAASSRRLRVAGASLLLLSPYAWIYSRVVWDNPWIIPLGALALAAYVSFGQSPARDKAWIACLALFLALMVHPMCMPLALAIAIHAYRMHRDWARRHLYSVLSIGAVCLLIALPWLLASLHITAHVPQVASAPPPPLQPPKDPPPLWYASSLFGLFGGRPFSAMGLDYFLEPGWTNDSRLLRASVLVSSLAYALVWFGAVRCALRVRRAGGLFAREQSGADHQLDSICLLAFAIGCVFLLVLGRHTHPHYYNGLWIVYGYFIWSAVSERSARRSYTLLLQGAGAILAAALLFATTSVALRVHRLGGTRGVHFGATLGNQIELARVLARSSPDAPVSIEVKNWLMFPHALPILRRLTQTEGDPNGPTTPIAVHYRDDDPNSGWIVASPGPPQSVLNSALCVVPK